MITTTTNLSSPLNNLGYFVEWGAKPWEKFTHYALSKCIGINNLIGKDVLEIGSRYGKMATLFALLGANVTGIDLYDEFLRTARDEAAKHNVSDRTKFIKYDGDLDLFADESFDIIFTKSVLVVVPELESFLITLGKKLKPDGKIVFIENGYGNIFLHLLRKYKHKKYDYSNVNYFGKNDIRLFKRLFDVKQIKKSLFPPVFMIYGKKMEKTVIPLI
jgi:SAM-dependent methyltransferase